MIRDYHYVMRLPGAEPRDINSINNWIDGTGSIARMESAFLQRPDDMSNLIGTPDSAVSYIEIAVEKIAYRLSVHMRKGFRLFLFTWSMNAY